MMFFRPIGWLLPIAFVGACVAALWAVRTPAITRPINKPMSVHRSRDDQTSPAAVRLSPTARETRVAPATPVIRWRVPMPARPAPPCACADGWIVADAMGTVKALARDGGTLWQTAFSNRVFDAGATVVAGVAVVASRQGCVAALRVDSGQVAWTRELDATFQHAALAGVIDGESVVWLMSQADGQLTCLRVKDGERVWQSEPTSRCDGRAALWQDLIAYGNCDGAVYVFDAVNGRLNGSVVVGPDDQMAGGMLAAVPGVFIVGTRQGRLAVVNSRKLTLDARVGVSESEAFVTPVMAFDDLVATGTQEGEVVFCRFEGEALHVVARVALGENVSELAFADGGVYALSGGALCVLDTQPDSVRRVALGDDVYGLARGTKGEIVCVADQAVVCVQGGGQ